MARDRRQRKREQKRRQQREERRALEQQATEDLKHQVRKDSGDDRVAFAAPPDGTKMSDVLDAFVEPYMEDIATKEQFERLLMMAMAAWNAALMPEPEQMFAPILAAIPRSLRSDGRRLLAELLDRKRTQFADCRRAIIKFSVTDMPDGTWHLSVVSSLKPLPPGDAAAAPRPGLLTWLRSLWPWK